MLVLLAQIYTDWANHYLAKSGHKRLIKDLQQDIADGVLLAEIIQIIGDGPLLQLGDAIIFMAMIFEDFIFKAMVFGHKVIAPLHSTHLMLAWIENVDVCLSFLAARGVNVQGLSAEEIRNGNLKAILGLFFSLSRYKQQQHQQQQYYQSLVELQQHVSHSPPSADAGQPRTQQDMQSR
ncbi:hypothetical protein lerEdw1_020974 [Lerista edwardsae]|nr:hypothetical protein lerEdw1_020974 [Lerista edwardsae]